MAEHTLLRSLALTVALALALIRSLSPSLGLLSIRKTSKSQLETGKQPPESCPAQHGANVSDIGDKPAAFFFFAKKLNGNGACGWSVRSRPRPRRGRRA